MEQQNSMNIQWYPGHMTKTRRMMEEDLKLVDAVCEILDARIPISSRNPDIDAICGKKPRMVILNRIDMADPDLVSRWSSYFKAKGMAVIRTDCKSRRGINTFAPAVRQLLAEKLQRYAEKGQVGRPLKLMVVGIPNVGKSTFINQIAGRKGAKAENRPGVTRGKQWVNVDGGLLLRGQLAGLLQLALPHQGVQVVGQTAVYGVFTIRLGQGAVTPFRKMQRLCVRAFPPHAAWHCGRGGSRPAPRRRIRWACG